MTMVQATALYPIVLNHSAPVDYGVYVRADYVLGPCDAR